MKPCPLALLLALAAISASAGDASYFGKWKLNQSKSSLTNETMTFEKLPSGEYRFEGSGFAYNFKLDGKEYPTQGGGTASWKASGNNTWECTNRVNNKLLVTYKLTLKSDTISAAMTLPQSSGKDLTEFSNWKRISGGPGFPGKWGMAEIKPAVTGLELTALGADGLVMTFPEWDLEYPGKFDGKPNLSKSGRVGNEAMAFRRTGPNSFEATHFVDGKAIYIDSYAVSADGKILTDEGTPISKKESVKTVYDRQ